MPRHGRFGKFAPTFSCLWCLRAVFAPFPPPPGFPTFSSCHQLLAPSRLVLSQVSIRSLPTDAKSKSVSLTEELAMIPICAGVDVLSPETSEISGLHPVPATEDPVSASQLTPVCAPLVVFFESGCMGVVLWTRGARLRPTCRLPLAWCGHSPPSPPRCDYELCTYTLLFLM